jgi:GDP-L-fucose synthase
MELNAATRIVIVGHGDLIEAALRAALAARGIGHVAPVGSFNPLQGAGTMAFFEKERPECVILGPVRSGGIGINQSCPAEFFHDNMMATLNVMEAARRTGVRKILFMAPSCVYPRDCAQPMKEEYFQTGVMEPTSEAYSMARAAGIVMCRAYRRQYDLNAIAAVVPTVYSANPSMGEDAGAAHVLGAVMAKIARAVREKYTSVELWGTGEPRREFIFSEDLAEACLFLLAHYDGEGLINIGTAEEMTVRELAALVATEMGYRGKIVWDTSKPDGAPRKALDTARLAALGWRPKVLLRDGIQKTCQMIKGGV